MNDNSTRELQESRASKLDEMRRINETAKNEKRDLSGEERKRFDALDGEIRSIDNKITDAYKIAELERHSANFQSGDHSAFDGELRNYSLGKLVLEAKNGNLTGLESEVHQELSRGRREVRGAMVPTEILMNREIRAITTEGSGGNLVATKLTSMTDRRRPSLKIESLGATVVSGLTQNLDLPRLSQSGEAKWVAEHQNATRSDVGFSKKSMAPKTVTGEYELSRRMLLQSETALDQVLRADLGYLLAQALDKAAIRGGGTDEPTGILADSEVLSIDGGEFVSDIAADLMASLEIDDVTGTTGFFTNPNVMKVARKIKDTTGRNIPLAELFHNKPVESSTQVPSDLGDSSDKNALIYGEWASLYIGYWSAVDILVNPYHSDVSSKGGALLHAFLDADVLVRHPEGFRYAEID